MLIVLGIIKGGILYNNYLQLTDAVRSGARQLAIERGQAAPCDDAAAEVVTSASGGLNTGQLGMTMTENPDPDSPAVTYTYANGGGSGGCPTLQSGNAVTLQGTYPCDLQLIGVDFAPNCRLTATATERIE